MKATIHPLADDYLRRLDRAAHALPCPARNGTGCWQTYAVICKQDSPRA